MGLSDNTGKGWYTTAVLIAAGCWSILGIQLQDFVITSIKGAKTGWKSQQHRGKILSLLKPMAKVPLTSLGPGFHSIYLRNNKKVLHVLLILCGKWNIFFFFFFFGIWLAFHCFCYRLILNFLSPKAQKIYMKLTLQCLITQSDLHRWMNLIEFFICKFEYRIKTRKMTVTLLKDRMYSVAWFFYVKFAHSWPRVWPLSGNYVSCTSQSRLCAKLFSQHPVYS